MQQSVVSIQLQRAANDLNTSKVIGPAMVKIQKTCPRFRLHNYGDTDGCIFPFAGYPRRFSEKFWLKKKYSLCAINSKQRALRSL